MTPEEMTAQIQHLIESQKSLGDNLDRLYEETTELRTSLTELRTAFKESQARTDRKIRALTRTVHTLADNVGRLVQVVFRHDDEITEIQNRLDKNGPPPQPAS
jgi:predicted RNase H-like nuclease (RuvC/YqgF family)